MTRREFSTAMLGGLVAAPLAVRASQRPESRIAGVRIGAQSYSFRSRRSIDEVIQAYVACGLTFCELWSNHVETPEVMGPREGRTARDHARQWRLQVPMDHFTGIRKKFDAAGITLTAYNLSFQTNWSPEEIERGFEMARALGVPVITASAQVSTAKAVDPFARKSGIIVAFHNHSQIRADEFATPDDFAAALKGGSDKLAINLDIGHFTAANFDPLEYLDTHHERIVSLHLKDRRRDQGPNVPFGEGDTPIVAVLQRLRDRKWDIPAHIEYEYRGGDAVDEVRKCFEFCRQALLG